MNFKAQEPNYTKVNYYEILPYHGNGVPKEKLGYRDYFDQNKVFLRHYTQYLDHKDEFENDTTFSMFLTENLTEDANLIKQLNEKKFTLIYLFTISKITSFLIRQISGFSHHEVAMILFVDNKSNRTKLYNLFSQMNESKDRHLFDNLYLVDSPRFVVEWGQISIPLSQFVMITSSLKYFPNSMYVSLHSESDYRIIPNNEIMKYLKSNYPQNYIAFTPQKVKGLKIRRTNQFKLFVNHSKLLVRIMKKAFPNRIIPKFKWNFGSNWITVTLKDSKSLIEKILSSFSIIDFIDYISVSDELIFQTVAVMANINYTKTNHRYIDWTNGGCHPKVLNEEDFYRIINDTCSFWARKFNYAKSDKLLDMIDDYIEKLGNGNEFKMCSN